MNGWVDGLVGEWMDGRIHGWVGEWTPPSPGRPLGHTGCGPYTQYIGFNAHGFWALPAVETFTDFLVQEWSMRLLERLKRMKKLWEKWKTGNDRVLSWPQPESTVYIQGEVPWTGSQGS